MDNYCIRLNSMTWLIPTVLTYFKKWQFHTVQPNIWKGNGTAYGIFSYLFVSKVKEFRDGKGLQSLSLVCISILLLAMLLESHTVLH